MLDRGTPLQGVFFLEGVVGGGGGGDKDVHALGCVAAAKQR